VHGVGRAGCRWWIVLERAADGPVTGCHRHQVLPLGGLLKRDDIVDVLGDAKRVEVHSRHCTHRHRGYPTRLLAPDPEADGRVRARGKANATEDDLLGVGSVCSRGQTERNGDRKCNRHENWNRFLHDETSPVCRSLASNCRSDSSPHRHHVPLVCAVRRSPFSRRVASPNSICAAAHHDNPL
jgi:hypothetical protein